MAKETYVTSLPDKPGAFLSACRGIAALGGNIIRVGYNKAVDLHTLFVDVEAPASALEQITRELDGLGFLTTRLPQTQVLVVELRLPDRPGSLVEVLEVLAGQEVNISYMNSVSDGSGFQSFRMGLLIRRPEQIKSLLGEISRRCPISIVDYDDSQPALDNTVFYIRLAGEMQSLFGLSDEETMEFLSESARILQLLEGRGENPATVFDYIRRLARFVAEHKGERFAVDLDRRQLSPQVTLTTIQPPCGSNTYVLEAPGELVIIDTGFASYAPELTALLLRFWPDWAERKKRVLVTHADVDHCGLLSSLEDCRLVMNQKSAQNLRLQWEGKDDLREQKGFCLGYSKLSRIISGYRPPDPDRIEILDRGTPESHEDLLPIGEFRVGDMTFQVLEGAGGHLPGEMVFLSRTPGVMFTGDILVNILGFTPERREFNAMAPYLMTTVNVDSPLASRMRRQVTALAEAVERENAGEKVLICGGHGDLGVLEDHRLVPVPRKEGPRCDLPR